VTANLKLFARTLLIDVGEDFNLLVMQAIPYYKQLLVAISMAAVCGMKTGQRIGWILLVVNLIFLWSQI